ncbi:leucine-rich repeat domain-containing protein [Antarctobacter jejuensis]|uniref:leucine-rich repeat domain-containing protein n=1 Tax=Antarctobacter jejuensis TaxID=1439938 RepID=UPI003FD1A8AD
MAQGGNDAELDAEVRDIIQSVKLHRGEGLSFLYLEHPGPLRRLPPEIGRLDWMTWLDLEGTQIADLQPLAPLTQIEKLDLRMTRVTDLSPLSGMRRLRNLYLEGSPVADLSPLAGLTRLKDLWLNGTKVTDLSPLASCKGLQTLSLRRTEVTDLSPLADLPELAILDITETQVSDLSPLLRLPSFCEAEGDVGFSFEDTPAVARSKALARIAEEEDDPTRRAELVLDHLMGGTRTKTWRGDA